MHKKDFPAWFAKKVHLDNSLATPYFNEREVWWTSIGHNVGDEEDGKNDDFSRPVLILRKFNSRFFYGLPLSSKTKTGPYYHSFSLGGGTSIALLSHLRDYDARRLINKLDMVAQADYAEIQKKLAAIITRPAP
jgi:mRNA interferase MazF